MKRIFFIIAAILGILIGGFSLLSTPNPDTLLKQARRQFDAGKYAQARPGFARVRQISKASSGPRCEAYLFYATCFVRENKFPEAIRELEAFVREYPNSFWTPQAYFDLAYSYRSTGNNAPAQKYYDLIIDRFPTTTWAGYSRDRLKEMGLK
jgi:TolA-binding protein